jgi:hypothetical protein
VGPVLLGGTASFGGTTALEFGPDGVLYALPNNISSIQGHLLSIDEITGDATDLGFIGAGFISLTRMKQFETEVPSPASQSAAILCLVLLALGARELGCLRHRATA